jgi:hypothetical protein
MQWSAEEREFFELYYSRVSFEVCLFKRKLCERVTIILPELLFDNADELYPLQLRLIYF